MKSLFVTVKWHTIIVREEDLVNVLCVLDTERLDRSDFSMGRVDGASSGKWFINLISTKSAWENVQANFKHNNITVLIAEKDKTGKIIYREL